MTRMGVDRLLGLPSVAPECVSVWNQFTIRVPGGRRDALQQFLSDRKIGAATFKQLTGNWGQPLQRITTVELPVASLAVIRHPEPIAQQTIFIQ